MTTPHTASAGNLNIAGDGIFIVGTNITQEIVNRLVNDGKARQVMQRIYVDTSLTVPQANDLIAHHACRVLQVLHKGAVLVGPSAYHHEPVNNILHVGLPYGMPPRMVTHSLSFQYSKITRGTPHEWVTVRDSIGEFLVPVLPDEVLILQAFTKARGNLVGEPVDRLISNTDMGAVIKRAAERVGGVEALMAEVEQVARRMKFSESVLLRANDFIALTLAYDKPKSFLHNYSVYWAQNKVGKLRHDGLQWNFDYEDGWILPLSFTPATRRGQIPFFIEALLPESNQGKNETHEVVERTMLETLSQSERFLSNVTIRPFDRFDPVSIDYLQGRVADHGDELHIFTGRVDGMPTANAVAEKAGLNEEVKGMRIRPRVPRMSGIQTKLPVNLSADGNLTPVLDASTPFTHILKFPVVDHIESTIGVMEWACMEVARKCGMQTEDYALVKVPDIGWCFLAERFDIKKSPLDACNIMTEDVCSAAGLPRTKKFDQDINVVASTIRRVSTAPEEDAQKMFKLTLFSWLIGNSDMHLKNILFLKKTDDGAQRFTDIRLSPIYDILPAVIYNYTPRAAITVAGKNSYGAMELMLTAKALGISKANAMDMTLQMITEMTAGIDEVIQKVPAELAFDAKVMQHLATTATVINARASHLMTSMITYAEAESSMIVSNAEMKPEEIGAAVRRMSDVRDATILPEIQTGELGDSGELFRFSDSATRRVMERAQESKPEAKTEVKPDVKPRPLTRPTARIVTRSLGKP